MVGEKIMNKIKLLIIFLFVTALSFGAIIMKTSDNKIGINEGIEVAIEFIDTDKGNYVIEGLDNFDVVSRGSSSFYTSVNFKSSKKLIDKYILRPRKTGKFKLETKTETDKSNILNIEVTNENNSNLEDSVDTIKNSSELKDSKAFFIKNNLENKTLYFGQKEVYEENFIGLKSLRGFQYKEQPVFTDLSVKDFTPIGRDGNLVQSETSYNGIRGFKLNLYRGIIQGNSSGEKLIKTAKVEAIADKILYLGGKNIKLKIIPLPEGKNESYRDIVGNLKIESNWTNTEIKMGETVTLNVRLYGDVNLDNINSINIQKNGKYNVFETIKKEILEIRRDKVYSEKDFEIVFVPKKSGEIIIPSTKIGYFNTETKKYEEKIISEQKIDVKPNSELIENKVSDQKNEIKDDNLDDKKIEKEIEKDVSFEFINKVKENNKITTLNLILLLIIILEGILIIYLLLRNKNKKIKEIDSLKDLKKVKTQEEFYKAYCEYMKKCYDFNPNAHSESKLKNIKLIEINRIMEEYKYSKINFDMKQIVKKLEEIGI